MIYFCENMLKVLIIMNGLNLNSARYRFKNLHSNKDDQVEDTDLLKNQVKK